jgi:hypothetical protein
VPRLVKENLDFARQDHCHHDAESGWLGLTPDFDAARPQLVGSGLDVVTHERDFMPWFLAWFQRVDAEFRWREGEDQPAWMGFNTRPFEDVPENGPKLIRRRGIEQSMDTRDRHKKDLRRPKELTPGSAALTVTHRKCIARGC